MRRIAATAIIAYLCFAAFLFVFQRNLLYLPDSRERVLPSSFAMLHGVREVALRTADDVDIYAWHVPAPRGRPTVVLYHCNYGSLASQRFRIARFRDAGMGVLAVSYRGYSGSSGLPSEEGTYQDARAALDWLKGRGAPSESIVLYGESLGSGVAIKMAAERNVALLIVEAPYTSITDVGARLFPLLPVRWLLWDRYEAVANIGAVRAPVLMMHGSDDSIIPQALGRFLFAAANEPKQGYWPVNIGHNDIFNNGGFLVARDFIERHHAPVQVSASF